MMTGMPSRRDDVGKVGTVDDTLEEPLSKLYYAWSNALARRVRVNPNLVTLLRLLLMIAATALVLWRRSPWLGVVLLHACWFLDHLDGEMARVHNMVTKFGDYFDHVVDTTYLIPISLLLLWRVRSDPSFPAWLAVLVGLVVTSALLTGCQEAALERHGSTSTSTALRALRVCERLPVGYRRPLRYLGPSALFLMLGALLLYAHYAVVAATPRRSS